MDALRFIEDCIERYAKQAWRTAYVALSNAADADDLLQQAFIVAWRKAEQAPRDNPWPWLAAVIGREAMNFRRRRARRRAASLDEAGELAMETPRSEMERAELSAILYLALADLSLEQRLAVVLTHLAGLSQQQAADAMGVPLNTLKARHRRALEVLRVVLGDRAPDLASTLRALPVALPPGGLAAASAGWGSAVGAQAGAVVATGTGASIAMKVALGLSMALVAVVTVAIAASPDPGIPPQTSQLESATHSADRSRLNPKQNAQPEQPLSSTAAQPPAQSAPLPESRPEEAAAVPEAVTPAPPVASSREPALPDEKAAQPESEPDSKVPAASEGELESYKPVSGIGGTISSVGSDTLNNLMNLWLEGFKKECPLVKSSLEGKGSGTAIPALIDGKANIGPMSRPPKAQEIKQFVEKFGYQPTVFKVAVDALAVFVHKDNQIEKLTLPQVDAVFSKSRLGKFPSDVARWDELGLKGGLGNLGITLYGRNNASGTHGYFKEVALYKGDFKESVKEQPGCSTVIQLITEDRSAIGYSSIGYAKDGVRAVPLAKDAESEACEPLLENIYDGNYPLARYLYVVVNKPDGKRLDPVVHEFLRFAASREGQSNAAKEGFIPLRRSDVTEQLAALE